MNRLILPAMGMLYLCTQSFSAQAVESTSATASSSSMQQVREQIEAKRDQLSGAARLSKSTDKGTGAVLDAPVVTDDAPAQEQQP